MDQAPQSAQSAQGKLPADVVIEMRDLLERAFAAADKGAPPHALARLVEDIIRREWGGLNLYIPTGSRSHTEWLREQVRARWNGRNTVELSRELRISERRMRQLRDEVAEREQPSLF